MHSQLRVCIQTTYSIDSHHLSLLVVYTHIHKTSVLFQILNIATLHNISLSSMLAQILADLLGSYTETFLHGQGLRT